MTIEAAAHRDALSDLRLWQLLSPALPVGAFAYSQGLEQAVHRGDIGNRDQALHWIRGVMRHAICTTDVPALHRLYQAWQTHDTQRIVYWNAWLRACRASRELREEDANIGSALARLLASLGIAAAAEWQRRADTCHACMLALAGVTWRIPAPDLARGLLWSWCENQVSAAIKLVPLGQTDGQRILSALLGDIPELAAQALLVGDADMGYGTPGQTLASVRHETQYSRLFRS